MTTAAIVPGEGTTLAMGDGGGTEVFTVVSQVTEIQGPGMELAAIPTYHLGSTVKTTRPSKVLEPGEVSFKAYFDPTDTTSHQLVLAAFLAGTAHNWQLTFNVSGTGHLWAFSAFITKFEPTGMQDEENLEVDVTIKVNSVPARS